MKRHGSLGLMAFWTDIEADYIPHFQEWHNVTQIIPGSSNCTSKPRNVPVSMTSSTHCLLFGSNLASSAHQVSMR